MTEFRLRFFWPVALATITLVSLCVFTAVSLFRQQATIATVFRENITARRAAVEMEECLSDLIALVNEQVETVSPLHTRARAHLGTIQKIAAEPEEQKLAERMTAGYDGYLQRWRALPPPGRPGHEAAVRDATRFLDAEVLRPCQEFRLYTGRQLEETTARHERVLRQLAWGMAGVGGLGGFAGLVLGYGLARGLSRSLHRLQVRIRDAAGKLAHTTLPEIVFIGDSGFDGLNEQIDRLTARIEQVVQQLQDREREVIRAEQLAAVGQLAAGVGHEVRNPLTSIKMLVQAGLEDRGSGLTAEDLRVIEAEIRRMERSLQTFLDFARPAKPERRPVDLLAVINTVVGLTRGRAEKQRVTTRVDAPAGGVTLTADPGQLQQVLVNLVLNALDAMPAGGTLTTVVRRDPSWVILEVTDTGPGIIRDLLPRLFEPFVTSKETGLGLGLVISRRIVEDHGGTIGAANRPGGGASFVVRLPVNP